MATRSRRRSPGKLDPVYVSTRQASLAGSRAALGSHQRTSLRKSVTIATRGCPHRCDYCSIPLLYGPGTVRYRPVDEVVREVATSPTRAVVFWDDNIGANARYAKELFRALTPIRSGGQASVRSMPRATRNSSSLRRGAAARRCSWASNRSRRRASRQPTRRTTASTITAVSSRIFTVTDRGPPRDHVRVRPGRHGDLPAHRRFPR